MLLYLCVFFIAFCDINTILYESTISQEWIRIILELYAYFIWSLHNPDRNMHSSAFRDT